jgi:hypothetical protein
MTLMKTSNQTKFAPIFDVLPTQHTTHHTPRRRILSRRCPSRSRHCRRRRRIPSRRRPSRRRHRRRCRRPSCRRHHRRLRRPSPVARRHQVRARPSGQRTTTFAPVDPMATDGIDQVDEGVADVAVVRSHCAQRPRDLYRIPGQDVVGGGAVSATQGDHSTRRLPHKVRHHRHRRPPRPARVPARRSQATFDSSPHVHPPISVVVLPALLSPSAPRHPTAPSLSSSLGNPTESSSLADSNWTNATKSTSMSSSRPTTDPSILLLLPSNIRSNRAIDEEIDGGGTTNDRAGGRSTLRALHPVGPLPSGGPVAGHDDRVRPQEHRQLPRPKRRRQERHQRRRRTLQHLARAASMFADSASPMSSSSPSASSAPSVVRPRSRCRPPGGRTSTSSIARSSPRVGRLPRSPSSPRAAVAVDATIVVAWREGRNRRAWLSTRRRCRAARATNRPMGGDGGGGRGLRADAAATGGGGGGRRGRTAKAAAAGELSQDEFLC